MRRLLITTGMAALFLMTWTAAGPAADKIQIEKLDDLPRHTYQIDVKAVDLLDDTAALDKLAGELKRDLESDLETYDIRDKTTLKSYYGTLGIIALLEGRYDDYLDTLAKRQALEDKEAARLMMGLFARAYIDAGREGGDPAAAFEARFRELVNALPYETVEAQVKQNKGISEILSRALVEGQMAASIQPMLDKTGGEASKDVAMGLVQMAYTVRTFLPLKAPVGKVYGEFIAAHAVKKLDIWADREVTLSPGEDLAPVVVAIWDSGVDSDVYGDRMWVNDGEIAGNGIDDDDNGYVDDVHGIGYTLESEKTPELLYPIGDVGKERPRLERQMKGLTDLTSGIDSPEAMELKKTMSGLSPEEVKPFIEGVSKYGNYSHGTHVAGIAARGNPYIRILVGRITFPYTMIPPEPTFAQTYRDAAAMLETVKYFKDHGVRVVNMSWGGSLASIEQALEAHDVGETPEERKVMAREMFEIGKQSMEKAFAGAPDILFVTAAGNGDNDVTFDEVLPSALDLPNIISVGAVDQSGEETDFTSFGKVDVYANGFEVPSHVPGGDEMNMSGTSMSSPNVVNLAAKLLAVRPDLTPAALREIIVGSCDEHTSGDRTVRLINPKKAMELARTRK